VVLDNIWTGRQPFQEDLIMAEQRGTDRAGRRSKRFLTPLQKYEIWLQLVRQEVTMAEAADAHQVDRSTIMRIRTVAKEGALAALAESRPGVKAQQRDVELEATRAEVARLSAALTQMAVKLTLVEGKTVGAEWPHPPPGRGGHQGRASPAARSGDLGRVERGGDVPGAGAVRMTTPSGPTVLGRIPANVATRRS
jgi:transposase-like protein